MFTCPGVSIPRMQRRPQSLERGSTSCHCTQGPGCCPSSGCMCMPCSASWGWEPPGLLWASPAKVEPLGTPLCPAKPSSELCAVFINPAHAMCLSCTSPASHQPPAVPQVCSDLPHSFVSSGQPASVPTAWDMGVPRHFLASDRDRSVPSQCHPSASWPRPPCTPRCSPHAHFTRLPAGWDTPAQLMATDCTPIPLSCPPSPCRTSGVMVALPPRLSPLGGARSRGPGALPDTSFTHGQVLGYIMDNSRRETLLIIQTHTEGRKCTLDFHVATRSCEAGSGCLFPHVTATQWVADSPESLAWGQEKAENTMSVHILSLKITLQHRLRRIKIRSGAVSRREEDEEGKARQGNGRSWAASAPGADGEGEFCRVRVENN